MFPTLKAGYPLSIKRDPRSYIVEQTDDANFQAF